MSVVTPSTTTPSATGTLSLVNLRVFNSKTDLGIFRGEEEDCLLLILFFLFWGFCED
ncbi:hypothetical protein LguiA_003454 [Lonicera macranthoides]